MHELHVRFRQLSVLGEAAAGNERDVGVEATDEILRVTTHEGDRAGGKLTARAEIAYAAFSECDRGGGAIGDHGQVMKAREVGNEVCRGGGAVEKQNHAVVHELGGALCDLAFCLGVFRIADHERLVRALGLADDRAAEGTAQEPLPLKCGQVATHGGFAGEKLGCNGGDAHAFFFFEKA